jgi:hypothetical protein
LDLVYICCAFNQFEHQVWFRRTNTRCLFPWLPFVHHALRACDGMRVGHVLPECAANLLLCLCVCVGSSGVCEWNVGRAFAGRAGNVCVFLTSTVELFNILSVGLQCVRFTVVGSWSVVSSHGSPIVQLACVCVRCVRFQVAGPWHTPGVATETLL